MAKAKLITYERVINLGNYESERIGVQLEPSEGFGESAQEIFEIAFALVEKQLPEHKRRRTVPLEPEDAEF